ncbi:MAG: hypothetical protein ACKOYJ_02310 [Planctomycetia bacterium]
MQPVEIAGPPGIRVAIETAAGWSNLRVAPLRMGLVIGRPYRLRITGIPGREGEELYPSICLLAKLAAPPGMAWRFPAEVMIEQEDLEKALDGGFVRRAVYVSCEADAPPAAWFDVEPGDDCLEVAAAIGDPVAELVIGNRVPSMSPEAAVVAVETDGIEREAVAPCQAACLQPTSTAILPMASLPPVALPCPICDGGDHASPAKPVGDDGIANLTSGDTVARFRAADGRHESGDVCITASNCTCVYAPKFASVRQVVLPSERVAPVGVKGLAREDSVADSVRIDPVRDRVQSISLRAARKAQPGMGLQERLGPLGVDQAARADAADRAERPAERIADEQPLRIDRRQNPAQLVGFDVPMAWTCVRAANVLVSEQTAQVVSADRGTATLRFEEPGRAELTICKRAGSDTARVGEELDFTIFLLNSGDRALDDIVLVDALPDRLTLIPRSAASSLPADISTESGDDGSVVVKWRFREPLPAGGSGFVRFRTLVR